MNKKEVIKEIKKVVNGDSINLEEKDITLTLVNELGISFKLLSLEEYNIYCNIINTEDGKQYSDIYIDYDNIDFDYLCVILKALKDYLSEENII